MPARERRAGAATEPLTAFAVAPPGLETIVATELRSLGIDGTVEQGGVTWTGGMRDVMRVCLHARTPARVLVRIATFNARTFAELERRAPRVPWARFLGSRTATLRVTCRKSKLYHEGAVAERLHDAIAETTGRASAATERSDDVDVEDAQLFVVRLFRDRCTISADACGARLHVRGYRRALARAPLRENLAAAMLLASGWDRRSPLLDPLCGSGTIAIEAALLARDIAPGIATAARTPREFAFTRWQDFDPAAWRELVDEATERVLAQSPARILASDRAAGAIRAARANAERAGVEDDIVFEQRPLESLDVPGDHGWLVTNPPYGVRVGPGGDAAIVSRTLERLASGPFERWTVARLVAGRQVPGEVAFETRNGGIRVRFVVRRG